MLYKININGHEKKYCYHDSDIYHKPGSIKPNKPTKTN